MQTESTLRPLAGRALAAFAALVLAAAVMLPGRSSAQDRSHPRLMTDQRGIDSARQWIARYPWYREIFTKHRAEVDRFIAHGPIYVSPIKQTYVFDMYTCPKHRVELLYEEFRPFQHRCPSDTTEIYSGGKYDMAWAGWYNRLLATDLVWMGLLYNVTGEEKYAAAGKEILMNFADLYLKYTTENTILGPAHVFFGTLSESFWGVDMAYGYDLLYNYPGFSPADRAAIRDSLLFPLAYITQQFPETASNRQLWYNNVSAAVGFLYGDSALIHFALDGKYGFRWQLSTALPESGFWPEWSGYHFVALRGMIHLAEMASHNGYDLYHLEIAGRTMKKMFDAPFLLITPGYEFPRNKDSGGGSLLEYAPFYEVGYAVYGERKYLSLLNRTQVQRGTQIVGESSALGRAAEPVSIFHIVPALPPDSGAIYPAESVNLLGNGFAILRDTAFGTYLTLDYGIQGGEHGHPDRLQIGYYAGGRNWIVDPLNESYMNPNLQLWYHRSIAHNVLVVDETDQAWTNGYGNFFGSLPSLQVASGGSSTEYAGITLTRTVVQAGEYFIDLVDADAPEPQTFDLPYHGFGTLALPGLSSERQPVDLFGNRPGIPGYDQFTDIDMAPCDTAFQGVFTDRGSSLLVRVIGERGTSVYRAMNPPLGGFYKQMTVDQSPVPVLMIRRSARATRFASVLQAFRGEPSVTGFVRGRDPGTYEVRNGRFTDIIGVDIPHSVYTLVREDSGFPAVAAGFNVRELRHRGTVLLSSPVALAQIECDWRGDRLAIQGAQRFPTIRVLAPRAASVSMNGLPAEFRKEGEYVVVQGTLGLVIGASSPLDSVLFLGMQNQVSVTLANFGNSQVQGSVTIGPAPGWREKLRSQVEWWGGIVNLVATNKGPVERVSFPEVPRRDVSWLAASSAGQENIPPGASRTLTLRLDVPNDAPAITYEALVAFGPDTVRKSFVVRPPVTGSLHIPNGEKERLVVELTNRTPSPLLLKSSLGFDAAWQSPGFRAGQETLLPLETRRVTVPLRLTGYTEDNQRYPIRLRLESGNFRRELTHDFYVGVVHHAAAPPSLDGSWKGWDTARPMLIDRPSQIGRLLFGNRPWHGTGDLSAKVFAMYDRTYLYVGAAVTDDSVVSHWDFPRMEYPWDSDCMEVVLDVRTTSLQGHDPPTPGTYRHLSLAEYRRTDFSALTWQGAGASDLPKPNLVPGGETYFHRTKKGYAMIARFPLADLPGIVARPGCKIGFDLALNDNDGTSFRKNQHIWAGYDQNQSWWDIGTTGALIFGQ